MVSTSTDSPSEVGSSDLQSRQVQAVGKKLSQQIEVMPEEVPTDYELYIDLNLKQHWYLLLSNPDKLHWPLLLKPVRSEPPYLTLQTASPDFDILTLVTGLQQEPGDATFCGNIPNTKLADILAAADSIIARMGEYSLLGNCQNFCNNFLQHYRFPTHTTTLTRVLTTLHKTLAIETHQETIQGAEWMKDYLQSLITMGTDTSIPKEEAAAPDRVNLQDIESKLREILYFASTTDWLSCHL